MALIRPQDYDKLDYEINLNDKSIKFNDKFILKTPKDTLIFSEDSSLSWIDGLICADGTNSFSRRTILQNKLDYQIGPEIQLYLMLILMKICGNIRKFMVWLSLKFTRFDFQMKIKENLFL